MNAMSLLAFCEAVAGPILDDLLERGEFSLDTNPRQDRLIRRSERRRIKADARARQSAVQSWRRTRRWIIKLSYLSIGSANWSAVGPSSHAHAAAFSASFGVITAVPKRGKR